jgi:hypothetical protein
MEIARPTPEPLRAAWMLQARRHSWTGVGLLAATLG